MSLLATDAAFGQQVNLAPPPPAPTLPPAFSTPQGPAAQPAVEIDDRIAFNSTERWLIPDYFQRVREKQSRASRAAKFQRGLPEGIAKAPRKGDLLPANVVASLHRLPGPLLRELPPARPDTERLVVGIDIILLRRSSGEVLDVLGSVIE
ncbi:MAG: hypothetical protein ACK4FJ_07930 [Ferrovibrio sp.]|uniref:hypothetical protein n=1 Tax=Ferrovibrio sp. TaxID=1917215 RepID=UPI00391AA7B2